jgi:hypothetical protein
VREGAKNNVNKGAHLGPLNEGEPRALTLSHFAREVEVLKRYSVGDSERELRSDFLFIRQILYI